MKSIVVFRLENSSGIGPFRGGHRQEAESLKIHMGIKHCLVDGAGMKPRIFKKLASSGWSCAWSSESIFDEWMNGFEKHFESLGYVKVKYLVSKYKVCPNQFFEHYDDNIEDYVQTNVDGFQVFFNPRFANKII